MQPCERIVREDANISSEKLEVLAHKLWAD